MMNPLNIKKLVIAMAMMLCVSATHAYDFENGGLCYNINSSNTVSVTYRSSNYNSYSGSVTIPATVTHGGTTYRVTEIGASAFRDCADLEWLTIDADIVNVGPNALSGCTSIEKIVFPNSLSIVGSQAMQGCSTLFTVYFGSGLTQLGANVFMGCDELQSVDINTSTPPRIYFNTFTIGQYGNVQLSVPKPVDILTYRETVYWQQFADIVSNETYDFCIDGRYYAITGSNTVSLARASRSQTGCYSGAVSIPSAVTHGGTTYRVTAIADFAFAECTGLTAVHIPTSVTTIEDYVFFKCPRLTSIEIPNTVTTIGGMTFGDCTALKDVILPDGLTRLSGGMFWHCSALEKVDFLPESLTTIENGAFQFCENLLSVTIPDAVKTIGAQCFYQCTKLREVLLGNGVETIGIDAFNLCGDLNLIRCYASIPPVVSNSGALPPCQYRLYVPIESIEAYRQSDYWCDRLATYDGDGEQLWGMPHDFYDMEDYMGYKITGEGTVSTAIFAWKSDSANADRAYFNILNFFIPGTNWEYKKDYTFPTTVTHHGKTYQVNEIGEDTFCQADSLAHVTIPETVTGIGPMAFYKSGLTEVNIPDNVKSIGSGSFYWCEKLSSLTLGRGLEWIDPFAFCWDEELTTVTCHALVPPETEIVDNTDGEIIFSPYTYSGATLYVPAPSLNAYKTAYGWEQFQKIEPLPGKRGDLNWDGSIDVADVTQLIACILSDSDVDMSSADVNRDNEVDVADVTVIISYILSGQWPDEATMATPAPGLVRHIDVSNSAPLDSFRLNAMVKSIIPTSAK